MTFAIREETFIRIHAIDWAKEYCKTRIKKCGGIYNRHLLKQNEKETKLFLDIISDWAYRYKQFTELEDE